MINFDKMPCIYWSDVTKLGYLQRYIIIHSIIYYHLNTNCISDKEYDSVARQLVGMQKKVDRETLKRTMYYYCMYDFDSSTGFDLYDRLIPFDKEYLMQLARNVVRRHQVNKSQEAKVK